MPFIPIIKTHKTNKVIILVWLIEKLSANSEMPNRKDCLWGTNSKSLQSTPWNFSLRESYLSFTKYLLIQVQVGDWRRLWVLLEYFAEIVGVKIGLQIFENEEVMIVMDIEQTLFHFLMT